MEFPALKVDLAKDLPLQVMERHGDKDAVADSVWVPKSTSGALPTALQSPVSDATRCPGSRYLGESCPFASAAQNAMSR
jgi:hypothetical protein